MNFFEKLVMTGFVLLTLTALGWGFLFGLPSTVPTIAMSSEKISEQQYRSEITSEQSQMLTELLTPAPSTTPGRTTSRRPQSEVYKINRPLLQRLGNLTECRKVLMEASSEQQEDGSLKIRGIAQGSLFERVGLRENDILKSVNGVTLDFTSIGDCLDAHGDSIESLRTGNPVVIEIERRGSSVALVIAPPGL